MCFIPVFAHSLTALSIYCSSLLFLASMIANSSKYLLFKLVILSLHDSGGNLWSSEQMDLQVDYWLVGGNKKDINKVQNLQTIIKKKFKIHISSHFVHVHSW